MQIASIVEFDYEEIGNADTWEEAFNAIFIDIDVPFRVTVTKEVEEEVNKEDVVGSWNRIINDVFDGLEMPYSAKLDIEDLSKVRIVVFEGTSITAYSYHLEKLDEWKN